MNINEQMELVSRCAGPRPWETAWKIFQAPCYLAAVMDYSNQSVPWFICENGSSFAGYSSDSFSYQEGKIIARIGRLSVFSWKSIFIKSLIRDDGAWASEEGDIGMPRVILCNTPLNLVSLDAGRRVINCKIEHYRQARELCASKRDDRIGWNSEDHFVRMDVSEKDAVRISDKMAGRYWM